MTNSVRNFLIIGGATLLGVLFGVFVLGRFGIIFPLLILGGLGFYVYKMLSGNRTETQATPTERAAALTALPASGMGKVYVYRDGFVGKAMGIDVQIDGADFVQLKSPRFAMVSLPAGMHTVMAGPRGFAASQAKNTSVEFSLAAGETAVFRLEMAMGALKNSVLLVRDEASPLLLHKLGETTMVIPPRVLVSSTV